MNVCLNQLREWVNCILSQLVGRRIVYSLRYFHNRKKWPNLRHPKDMSEILIAKILDNKFQQFSIYADKITCREYVKSKGLADTLLQHYKYWEDAEQIDIHELPEKFVLKTNNGAGGHDVFVCYDKSRFNLAEVKVLLNKALKKKYNFEYHYREIKPLIICEELIETENKQPPLDYKITCIHGVPQDIMVGIGRNGSSVKISRRNIDWSFKDCTVKSSLSTEEPVQPKLLGKMIEVAKILSSDFDFVRVDLYEYKDKVIFGELTFSPAGGILGTYTTNAINEYGEIYREGL